MRGEMNGILNSFFTSPGCAGGLWLLGASLLSVLAKRRPDADAGANAAEVGRAPTAARRTAHPVAETSAERAIMIVLSVFGRLFVSLFGSFLLLPPFRLLRQWT